LIDWHAPTGNEWTEIISVEELTHTMFEIKE